MGLEFKDITDWKPTSISIVDQPAHPLAVFEVYEDDDEFIKKYRVDKMTQQTKNDDEKTVNVSESFLEKILGGLVSKQEQEPKEPSTPPVQEDNIVEAIKKLNERFEKMESRLEKLEDNKKPEEDDPKVDDEPKEDDNPAPGTVQKREGEGDDPKVNNNNDVVTDEGTINNNEVVSKSLDPDKATNNTTTKSFMERVGRSEDGMKW